MGSYFNLFQVVLSLWLLYYAVSGKGKIFENEYLKVPRKQYVRVMRILSLITGLIMGLGAALEYFGVITMGSAGSWAVWALTLAGCLWLIIYNIRCTDRAKANAAARGQKTPTKENPDPLHAAFVFGNEEDQAEEGKQNESDQRKEKEIP